MAGKGESPGKISQGGVTLQAVMVTYSQGRRLRPCLWGLRISSLRECSCSPRGTGLGYVPDTGLDPTNPTGISSRRSNLVLAPFFNHKGLHLLYVLENSSFFLHWKRL